jgi:hypothetical protein
VVAEALEGLATVMLAGEEPVQTARLLGAAGALRQEIAVPLPTIHQAEHRRCLTAARSLLGQDAFEEAFQEGRALLSGQALLALTGAA